MLQRAIEIFDTHVLHMSHVLEKRGKMWQAVFFTVTLVTFLPFLCISPHFSSFLCLFDLFGGASAKELKDMGFECRDLVDFFEVTDLVNATFSKVRLWQLWADHVQSKIVKGYQQRSQTARNSLFFMFFFSSVSRDFFLIFLIFS